jgi:hypothetical protein
MSLPRDHQLPRQLDFPADTPLAAAPLVCIECRRPWLSAGERWRLKVTDDATPETVPYCPDCATREFGAA